MEMNKIRLAAALLPLLLWGGQAFAQDKTGDKAGDKGKGGAGSAAKGKEVFESNCSVCHNSDSTETKVGPGLKGLFKKAELNNKKKVTETNVREVINNGGNGMPSYSDMLTAAEKSDVLAFLKTL
jgi:mono/diheme cytochrome c family protein